MEQTPLGQIGSNADETRSPAVERESAEARTAEQTRERVHVHVPALDGLRGIAILLVLGGHLVEASSIKSSLGKIALAVPRSGWAGVDLFFVLSGFLITGILLDQRSAAGYFRNFYARRVLRIFPLYYGVLTLVFVVLPRVTAFPQEGLRQLIPEQIWFWTYTSNLRSAATGMSFNAPGVFLGHFWSLAIEEQFYLIWPTVVFLCSPRALVRVCVAIIFAAFVSRLIAATQGLSPWQITAGTPFHVDGLAVGALLAWTARNRSGGLAAFIRASKIVASMAFFALAIFYLLFGGLRETAFELAFTVSLLAMFFGATLAFIASGPRTVASRMASNAFLRFFGRYSYGLYVFASLLQPYLQPLFSTKRIMTYVPSFAVAGLLHLVLEVAACTLVAVLSYHGFEQRFLALKRRFEYRRPLAT